MQKFDSSKGHSAQYIATHIARIEGQSVNVPKLWRDSLWRIASHCDLFPKKEFGWQLTEPQIEVVQAFVEDFKCNPEHQKLITKCREVRL